MAHTVGRLAGFLALMVAGGLLLVPRMTRGILRLRRAETTLIASIGICFAFAIIADRAGYSVALGAFLAGSLMAESGESHAIETLIAPVRDMFGAVFFVSVGMLIDPKLIAENWPTLLLLTGTVMIGKLFGVTLASMLSGVGVRNSVIAGMSLMQIGEFSFIIAGVGLELHATRPLLYTLAVAVSAITTFSTPFMIRAAPSLATMLAGVMPDRLGTLTSVYDSWTEAMRVQARRDAPGLVAPLLSSIASAAAIAAIMIVNEMDPLDLTGKLSLALKMTYFRAGLIVDLGALAVMVVPGTLLWFGSRALARALASRATPPVTSEEPAKVARLSEAFAALLHATILLVIGMPTLALVQPFVGELEGAGAAVIATVLLVIVVWRSGIKMQGQLSAIAALLGDALRGSAGARNEVAEAGLGGLTAVKLPAGAAAVGKTLEDLKVRVATGATVVAVSRDAEAAVASPAHEVLREGDVLEIAGATDEVAAAVAMLIGRPEQSAVASAASAS